MPRIDLSRQAAEFLEKLPAKQARQIAEKLKSLESDPSGLPTGALKGYSPLRRFQLVRPEIPVSGGPCL